MEVLAFTHAAVAYGDSTTQIQLRSPKDFIFKAPDYTLLGWLSFAAFAAVAGVFPEPAQAALCIQGDEGAAVEAIQTALSDEGYYFYGIDGAFESKTYDSVLDFQAAYGLPADGKVGDATLSALGLAEAEGRVFGYGETCNAGVGGGGGSPDGSSNGGSGTVSIATESEALLVRLRPTTASQDIDAIAKGTRVSYSDVATESDGTWLYVAAYGGWIHADYTTYENSGGGGGFQEVDERGTVRIATAYDPLLVRSQPTTMGEILDSLEKGSRVNYTKVASGADGSWLYVPAYGGWISANYTTYFAGGGGGTSDTIQTDEGSVRIATRTRPLIVRSRPTTESEALNVIAKGTQVTHSKLATGSAGKWLYVPFYGGWISAEYTTYGKADDTTSTTTGNATAAPSNTRADSGDRDTSVAEGNDTNAPSSSANNDTPSSPTTSDSSSDDAAAANGGTGNDTDSNTVAPNETAIVEEDSFELGRLAEVKLNNSSVYGSPNQSSSVLASIEQGTYVAYTKRAKLKNGEEWYFLPAYNGWILNSALEFVSIDFPK